MDNNVSASLVQYFFLSSFQITEGQPFVIHLFAAVYF